VSADLAITLADSRDPVMINNQLTYSLTVTNNGLDPAVGVRVTDTLPAGVSLVSSAPSQGSCSGASEINCEIGNLASGDSATITIIVTPSSAGTITNRASVMSGTPDARPGNNTATLETTVSLLPSIYGRVTTNGGAGFSGVNVAVNGSGRPPVVTTGDGNYQVSELALGGSYTVIPSREAFSFNPPNRTINNLQSDQRADFQGVTCSVSLSSVNQSFPATGGVGNVTIISPDPHCGWVARSHAPWIKLISATAGNGGAIVSFKVEPTVGSRTGTITINDNRFTVIQEFNPCGEVTLNNPKTLSINGLQTFSTQENPVAEDFNNDSVSDLVFNVSQPVPGLSIALSNSAGGYDDARIFYTGGVRAIRAGDLNKDGMNDLAITTTEAPERLLILNGNGAGGFSEPVNINTGPSPTALAIADFNGDGLSDLAVGAGPLTPLDPTQSNYSLTIHLSDGAGGFAAPRSFGFTTKPGSFPSQIEVGNFNGDGNLDLAVMGSNGPVIIFTGDGSEGFNISTISDVGLPGMMATGDFNGDLKTDLAVSQSGIFGNATTLIYVSTTAGMLQPLQPINLGRLLFATDIDGDGKSDLVLEGGSNQSSIIVLYAIGGGRFAEPVKFIAGGFPRFAVLGDFKQDGRDLRTDIFVLIPPGSFTNFTLEVAILTSDALRGSNASRGFGFVPPGAFDLGSPATDIESGDINGDGALDLVVAAAGLSNAAVLFGNGRGAFSPAVAVNTGIFFGIPTDTELRDFNNDGKLDLALISFNTKNVAVMLGDGRGGFTLSASFFVFNDAQTLASADFNNDGNLDLVTNAQPGGVGGLALHLGDGQGGFTKSADGFGGKSVRFKFITGDFNGDGAADLAFFDPLQNPGPGGFPFFVLFGNGQGGFGEPINISAGVPLSNLRAADLNLDGRDDLIYSSGSGISTVFVLLSQPGGSFASPVPIQIGPGATIRSAKDINGDGKPDLIAVSGFSIISILLGNGDGSFNQPVDFRAVDSPSIIVTGDFDDDGSVDIALAQTSIVGILLNRSKCVSQGVVVPASAASNFRYRVARNSIVTLHGENLAPSTRTAIPPFLPTSLANTRVKVKDAAGVERPAPLYFVSPDRITYLTPAQTSPGVALITVMNGGNIVAQGVASIAETDPGLFSADLSGQGYAAALVLRVRQDGSRVFEPVARFDFEENRFVAVPIDLSNEAEQVFLLLSGTGIRNHSGLVNVRAKVGSENAEVTFAGAEGILPGVDQVDLRLQPSLRGRGEVSVELSVDGRAANTVRIKLK
jgi:uncharacterized protein (TIGR03437 family)